MLSEILTRLYSSTIDLQLRAEHLAVLLIDRDDTADNDDNDVTENIGPWGHWPLLPMCLTRRAAPVATDQRAVWASPPGHW